MKSSEKMRVLLFASLGLFSLGLGFFNGQAQDYKAAQAKSKLPNIEVKDNMVEFGVYPQTIVKSSDSKFEAIKSSPSDGDIYTYNNEKYTHIGITWPDDEGGGKYSDGSSVIQGEEAFFKWEPIKWHVLYEDKDQNATFLFANQILDVLPWQVLVDKTDDNNWKVQGKDKPATNWEASQMRDLLNDHFRNSYFTDAEKDYMKEFKNESKYIASSKDTKDYVTIISPIILEQYKTSKNLKGGASDYAKARGVKYHFHNYDSSFFWVNRAKNDDNSKYLDYVRGMEVNGGGFSITVDSDDGIGTRPMIALDLSKVTLGGGTSESGTTKKTTNVSLIIGIIFSIFGMGGLITFLILWSKGKLSPAMGLKAIIPILAACVVVSSVGLISLTTSAAKGGGGGGIGCTFKPGYYLQSTGQYSGSSNGIAFVQVGLSCYRFNSDGTVNYCAACETNDASDFKADSGYGTWTKSGCSLSFNYTTPMGSVSTTFTISGDKLLYNGTEAYHWVRGE